MQKCVSYCWFTIMLNFTHSHTSWVCCWYALAVYYSRLATKKTKHSDTDRPGTKPSLCLSLLYPRVWLFQPLGSQQEFLKVANHISNSETEKHSKKCPFPPQIFNAPRYTVINNIFFDFSICTMCLWFVSDKRPIKNLQILGFCRILWKVSFRWVLWVPIQSDLLMTIFTTTVSVFYWWDK